jgi:hypothetical protein
MGCWWPILAGMQTPGLAYRVFQKNLQLKEFA